MVDLELVDNGGKDDGEDDGGDHNVEEDWSCHAQTKQCQWEDEEHASKVEDGKPSVLTGDIAKCPCH